MSEDPAREDAKERKRREIAVLGALASSCTACPLHLTRTKVVFGFGNAASPLMLVGEGPGANEDATGLPFIGRAGKLLDECLYAAGMKREHVYITNTVKCRACIVEGRSVRNRPPMPGEIGVCAPLWLEKQIGEIAPRVIVCIGSPSASTIIHKNFRMTAERGKWFESRYAPHVIAALHPAYILRQHGAEYDHARRTLIDDLAAAKNRAIETKSEPASRLF